MRKSVVLVPIALVLLTGVAWGAIKITVGTTGVHDLCGKNSLKCSGVTCGKTTCDASCDAGATPASGCTLVIHRTVGKPPRRGGGGGSVNR
jgi:hypothetical protein